MALSAVSCKPEHSRGFAYDSSSDYERLLVRLDKELVNRDAYVGARNARIDSLRMVRETASSGDSLMLTVEIANLYRGFLTDSALVECRRAERLAHKLEDSDMEFKMRLERIQQMPLVGFSHGAIAEFESFTLDSLSNIHQAMALWAGRQMYSYIAAQFLISLMNRIVGIIRLRNCRNVWLACLSRIHRICCLKPANASL